MHTLQVAVVGSDPRMSEPGSGERVDACEEVWRTATPPPGASQLLGTAEGARIDRDLRASLERLLADDARRAFLCGFDPSTLSGVVLRGLDAGRFQLSGSMHRILGVPVPDYGLDPAYRCNPVCYFDDTSNTDEWQREVYDLARDLAHENGWRRILDVGCGSGYKLVHWFPSPEFRTIGVDLPPTVEFLRSRYPDREWLAVELEREDMLRFRADLIIASDIIEHLAEPDLLLRFLASCECRSILLSTPDAATLVARGERAPGGPPQNPHHVREWTASEFARYVSGTLELVRQDLYPPNATQLVVCRPPGTVAVPARATSVREPAQRVVVSPCPGRRTPTGWSDAGANGYARQSRTRALEAALRSSDAPLVTVAPDPLETATELAPELERAIREGAEVAFRASSSHPGAEWNALDGIGLLTCERTRLLTALAQERGPHGPERALLRLADRSSKRHVVAGQAVEDPASLLARLEALVDLAGSGGGWPDPRPVMGPAVREAIERAEARGLPALAADLRGFWSAHNGAETPRGAPTHAQICAADPELAVPLDAGSAWTLVDPRLPDAFRIVLEHARREDPAPVLNLVLPWAAGLPIGLFAKRVVADLAHAGLDPNRVAPLVILERPLWSPEIVWLEMLAECRNASLEGGSVTQ